MAAAWAASDFITDREHVAAMLEAVPRRWHMPAVRAWAAARAARGPVAANLELRDMRDTLAASRLELDSTDDEVIALAGRRARDVRGHVSDYTGSPEDLRDRLERFARNAGVAPPEVDALRGLIARMTDAKWWRRALRRSLVRELERHAIRMGLVHRRAGLYASEDALERRGRQRRRNLRILEALTAVNDSGESFTLAELASLNVSNPAVRRAELMTRIAGFERFAQARGDAAMFYTLTCPSRMHARHAATGEENAKYDGTTPKAAQDYLARLWARARAKLHRRGAWVYGFRIAEPHHDGTPHWHLLLFCRPSYSAGVTAILEDYAHEADPEELSTQAAREARFKAIEIDPELGSAAGYVAKYVAKNIDGHAVGDDLEAAEPVDAGSSAARVDAWASTWGIRQFQQVGGPGVTIWRELRRLRQPQQLPLFDPLREAADAGQWAEYVRRMGGIEIRRRDRTLSLWRVDYGKENRYGEDAPPAIEGVQHDWALELCRTRMREWTIERGQHGSMDRGAGGAGDAGGKAPRMERPELPAQRRAHQGARSSALLDEGAGSAPTPQRVARAAVGGSGVPWTRVNNCTPLEDSAACDAWVADYERIESAGGRALRGPPPRSARAPRAH